MAGGNESQVSAEALQVLFGDSGEKVQAAVQEYVQDFSQAFGISQEKLPKALIRARRMCRINNRLPVLMKGDCGM